MTPRQQSIINFLRRAYHHCGESEHWILREIASNHAIKMTGWDKENECPVFEARAFKGTAKDWNIEQARLQGVR